MKGKIVSLDWKPGKNISSSRGANKYDIARARKDADFVQDNGFGNYTVMIYSKYYAKFTLADGSERSFDIKSQIKEHFNIGKMTSAARKQIEAFLPIDVNVADYDVTFLN